MIKLGEKYDPTWQGYPPRMSAEDYQIYVRYRPLLVFEATALYFDVGLGAGAPVPEGTPEEHARMWERNTQKRADIVAEHVTFWEIIELRLNANANAVGRLLQYRMLWEHSPPDLRPVYLTLVSNYRDPDVDALCKAHGIKFLTV